MIKASYKDSYKKLEELKMTITHLALATLLSQGAMDGIKEVAYQRQSSSPLVEFAEKISTQSLLSAEDVVQGVYGMGITFPEEARSSYAWEATTDGNGLITTSYIDVTGNGASVDDLVIVGVNRVGQNFEACVASLNPYSSLLCQERGVGVEEHSMDSDKGREFYSNLGIDDYVVNPSLAGTASVDAVASRVYMP